MQGTAVMQRNSGIAKLYLRWTITWLIVVAFSGCARFRIPRIDPTGQRIFLPAPAYTSIQPGFPLGGPSQFTGPAYENPPTPPLCPPGTLAGIAPNLASESNPVHLGSAQPVTTTYRPSTPTNAGSGVASKPEPKSLASGFLGQRFRVGAATRTPSAHDLPSSDLLQQSLRLTPDRLVALVGKPVLLKASLRGPDGTPLAGKPVEWTLSKESVGQIVAVSEQGQADQRRQRIRAPRKLSNDFAQGRTASSALTSAGPALRVGEAWLQMNSAREGISQVTVQAAGGTAGHPTRQTATIHWVDAKWLFPDPVSGNPAKPVELTTTVRRASNDSPAVGTVVRYEIVSGPESSFAPSGQRVVDVPVDWHGVARVQISPQHRESGETRIAMQVIRPTSTTSDNGPIILGQGTTSIRWSTPALSMRVTDPDRFDVHSTVTIRVDVTNSGDQTAENVVVSEIIPDGISFLNSDPPAQVFGDRIQWPLGSLAPGKSQVIEFNCRAERAGGFQHHLQARASNGATAEEQIVARATPEVLKLHVNAAPERALVGDVVQYQIIARNVSNQTLSNVIAHVKMDPGFVHQETGDNTIVRDLGDLPPGGEKSFGVTLAVNEPGTLCHVLELSADGGHATSQRFCLTSVGDSQHEPSFSNESPALSVTKQGPLALDVGQEGEFVIRIENQGSVPLTGLRVEDRFSPDLLRPVQASDGFEQQSGSMIWTIERLEPREYTTRAVRYRCQAPAQTACTQVTVASAKPALADEVEVCLVIHDLGDVIRDPEDERTPLPLDALDSPADANLASLENFQPGLSQPRIPGTPRSDYGQPPDLAPLTPPQLPDPAPIADAGDLRLTVTDLSDPVRQGRRMIYLVQVVNERNTADQDVQLHIEFPANLTLEAANMQLKRLESIADNNLFRTQSVRELRPGDDFVLRLEFTATDPGQAYVQVTLESVDSQAPVVVAEKTTIFGE